MARADVPAITWGSAFVNTLEFGYPLDAAVAWSDVRPGTEFVIASSGEPDAWDNGEDFFLMGNVRWIPQTNGTTPTGLPVTGWEGATGFRAFLAWARLGNLFRFIPNRSVPGTYITSYLVAPMEGPPQLEVADTTRRFQLVIRNLTTEYTGW